VTTLLSLEDEVRRVREVIAAIPTLAPGKSWVLDDKEGAGIFRLEHPEQKIRTRQAFKNHVLAEATKEHPAQVQTYTDNVPIGLYTTERLSGAVTPARKSEMLANVDALFRGIKQARQRANSTTVTQVKIGQSLVEFMLR